MASANLQIALPPLLMDYVDSQVEAGDFGTATEYVRNLIENDRQCRQNELEARLLKNLEGPFIEVPDEVLDNGNLVEFLEYRLHQETR